MSDPVEHETAEDKAPEPTPEAVKHAEKTRSYIWLGVFGIIALNVLLFLQTCVNTPKNLTDAAGRAVEKAGKALASVISAFNSGHVTTEFVSYASSIEATHRLQVATLKQHEIFTRRDEATTGFGYIPLPEVIVEARAPIEFTYYLDLNAPWKLVMQDNVIYVLAPRIQFNQPSVDVSAIQYEVRKDSVFRSTAESMDSLKKSITQLSKLKARENINLVRETGRRQTGEFVEKWLAKQFSDGKNYPVKVYFEGEVLPPALQGGSPAAPIAPPKL